MRCSKSSISFRLHKVKRFFMGSLTPINLCWRSYLSSKNLNYNLKNRKMKKILGILTVAVIAVTLSLNSNSSELNLSSLTSMNTADAESCSGTGCIGGCYFHCFHSFGHFCALPGGSFCINQRGWNG